MSAALTPPSQMNRDEFVDVFGGVYEHSPFIAAAAYEAELSPTHDSAEGLSQAMQAEVEAMSDDEKLTLLRAHPDLAGKLAVGGQLTAASNSEQASAGLDQCSEVEFEKFQTLNAAYVKKFGFPFILTVSGWQRADILTKFEARINNDPLVEFATALNEVHNIAKLRISNILNEA